ncbi:MAG: hypothetical protein ABIK09_06620 [Pseudomonadota bacterium]
MLSLFVALSTMGCDSGNGGGSAEDTAPPQDVINTDAPEDTDPGLDTLLPMDTAPELPAELCEPGYEEEEGACVPNCALLCVGIQCGVAGVDGECPCGDCDDCPVCQAAACVEGACLCQAEDGPCDDDDPCTESDACFEGACLGADEKNCDDGNTCTADGCEEGFCWHDQAAMQGATCDDGNPCTGPDLCGAGLCAGPLLPPGEAPIEDCLCVDDEGCAPLEDDDLCNGTLVCAIPGDAEGGTCQVDVDTIPACADDVDCTADLCDPQTGCQHLPDDAPCDDGVDCTADLCDVDLGCVSTPQDGVCGDGVDCTADACSPVDGCGHTPQDGACDDGIGCTIDACEPLSGCIHAADDGPCDDGIDCTADACVPGEGCVSTPQDGACDDGIDCTANSCVPGEGCVFTAQATACDDGVSCTLDACEPLTGCTHGTDDGLCDDGLPCTGDSCHPQDGCQHAPDDGACDDGIVCTADACKAGQGCTHLPDHGLCADGHPCTVDSCDVLQGCTYLTYDSLCDDAVDCTLDSCQIGQGCVFATQDAACDDGIGCTTDTCHPLNGCQNAPQDAVCEDLNDCTADACSPALGCTHTPQNDGGNCGGGGAICDGGACLFNCDGVGQWEWVNNRGIDGSHEIAQVIVPVADGYLQAADLLVWTSQVGGVLADLKVEVVSLSGGSPTGAVLQSVILQPWMFPDSPNGAMTFVFFNPAPGFTAGQPLALRLSSPGTSGGLPGTGYHLGVSCEAYGMPDVYPPGGLHTKAGGGWSEEACDGAFQLYVKQGIPCAQ